MVWYFLANLLILNLIFHANCDGVSSSAMPIFDNYVFVLNTENFDQFVNNNEITCVFFYAPWCGHCTNMKPFFHEAAKLLREDPLYKSEKPVVLAKVDATIEKNLTARFDIKGFPTLHIIRKGVVYDYDGPRSDAKEIASYLQKEASNEWKPVALEKEEEVFVIKSEHVYDDFVKNNDLVVIFLYAPWCGHCTNMKPFYHEAARLLAEDPNYKPETPILLAKIDATSVKSLAKRFNITSFPTIKIMRKGVEYQYDGPRSEGKEIATYLKREARKSWSLDGLEEEDNVFLIKTEAVYDEFVSKNDLVVLFLYAPWCGHCTKMKPFYHEAARLLKEDSNYKTDNKIVLAKVDATSNSAKSLVDKFNLVGYPTLKIIRKGQITFYEGPKSEGKEIAKYLQDQASNDWKPMLLEEEDNVFVLKSESTYEELISKYNLVILFLYAPWCGHCTNLKPHYHEAARLLKEDESFKPDKPVVLAKVDATSAVSLANRFNLQHYPTLKIIRDQKISDYEGPRKDAKEIANYVKGEASNNWKPPVSYVVELTGETFKEFVEKHDLSLVAFVSPNCGHCTKMAPDYNKAAKILSEESSPIPLAKVDVLKESQLVSQYKITSYPTIFIFRRGRQSDYNGGREINDFVQAMHKARSSSILKKVDTLKQLNSHLTVPFGVYMLGVFETENDELFKLYQDFNIKYSEDLKAFYTLNGAEFKVKESSILVYYHDMLVPKNQPKFKRFEGSNATELEEFVFQKSLPIISFTSSQNRILAFDKIKPICYLLFDIDIELRSHINSVRDKLVPVAMKFKEVTFVMANQTENLELEKKLLLDKRNNDVNFACINKKSKLFLFDEDSDDLDSDEISDFVKKMLNGKIKPYWRSEKVPKDNKKLVKKVVGSTFQSFIDTPDKEIFIVFYKESDVEKFDEMLTDFAKKYAWKKFLVGTIDVEKNDYSDIFEIDHSTPHIYFVPSNNKTEPKILFNNMNMLLEKNFPIKLDNFANLVDENFLGKKDKKEEL